MSVARLRLTQINERCSRCLTEARAKKLSFLKRRAYVRECMK